MLLPKKTAARRRYVIFALCLLTICGLFFTRMPLEGGGNDWIDKRMCYLGPSSSPSAGPSSLSSEKEGTNNNVYPSPVVKGEERSLKLLPDISDEERPPLPGRAIFFHETSCAVDYKIALNAR